MGRDIRACVPAADTAAGYLARLAANVSMIEGRPMVEGWIRVEEHLVRVLHLSRTDELVGIIGRWAVRAVAELSDGLVPVPRFVVLQRGPRDGLLWTCTCHEVAPCPHVRVAQRVSSVSEPPVA
jgi:hypothetical protein